MSLKGVSPVRVLAVVLYAQRTLGNSSGQAPFASSSLVLIILSSVRFVTSVCPFAWGCPSDENWFLMPNPEQKSLKAWLSNYRPLSEIIVSGIPNLQIIFFQTKLWILDSGIVARASALTHLVKQSIAISKNFNWPLP